MRRRSRAGGKSPNAQAPKAAARKSRIAPTAARPRSPSAAREETKVARLTRERDEAFQQQAATAEVLKVSAVTVMRDWSTAKAWLYREMTGGSRYGNEPMESGR